MGPKSGWPPGSPRVGDVGRRVGAGDHEGHEIIVQSQIAGGAGSETVHGGSFGFGPCGPG